MITGNVTNTEHIQLKSKRSNDRLTYIKIQFMDLLGCTKLETNDIVKNRVKEFLSIFVIISCEEKNLQSRPEKQAFMDVPLRRIYLTHYQTSKIKGRLRCLKRY